MDAFELDKMHYYPVPNNRHHQEKQIPPQKLALTQ